MVRGVALPLYPGVDGDHRRYDTRIDEIAATGANWVAIVVSWSQRDVRSNAIAPGKLSVDDALVRRVARRARARGLRVIVFPILGLDVLRRGEWRGTLRPTQPARWWLSYEAFILHYAGLAAELDTEALLIGSELASTEAWRDRWYHLISGVERVYSGLLVYSANWDHYQHVSFARRLDVFGVTGYQALATDSDASEAELTRAWAMARDRLLAHARARKLPLWITEVGYASVDGAATAPWDYTRAGRVDVEEQRRCYAAFRRAWDHQSGLSGVFFWNWHGSGGPRDRDYTPRGKPAEAVMSGWFRRR